MALSQLLIPEKLPQLCSFRGFAIIRMKVKEKIHV
jgi:hypothetical protein